MQCGDFDLYAKHLNMPKQHAVVHFQSILKRSGSVDAVRTQLQPRTQLLTPQMKTR